MTAAEQITRLRELIRSRRLFLAGYAHGLTVTQLPAWHVRESALLDIIEQDLNLSPVLEEPPPCPPRVA